MGCFLAVSMLLVTLPAFSADRYEYDRQDAENSKKKYLGKLAEDKRKVDLAIGNTKTLIEQSRNKSYLPELYLRLAELYVEKSRLVYFLRKGRNASSDTPGEGSGGGAQSGQTTGSSLEQLESNTLKNQAIEIYQRILNHYPDFPDCDKVRFFMAHEYRELGQLDEMVKQYRAIIKQYENSPYAPEAYLLMGDHLIHKQDLEMAIRHYQAVQRYPKSPANAIARYKLAWCRINQSDFTQALRLFEEAVTSGDTGKELDVDTYRRVDIRFESLIDMAFCYTEVFKNQSPQEALAYFEKYAWSRQVYNAVLEKLANRYYLKKKWQHAAEIYRRLCLLQEDPQKLLEYGGNIFECVQAMGRYTNAADDIALMVKALEKERYSVHIDDAEKKKHATDYELYARNMVTHLHNAARAQKSVEAFGEAAKAYKCYLDFFEESPVRNEMVANYAESLFSSEQFVEAGKQYEFLATEAMGPTPEKEQKLYGAVISYYTALKNKDKLNYYQTAYARNGLKTTGTKFAADFPNAQHVPDVRFNVAWISYDAGEFDDAIAAFKAYLRDYPQGKTSNAAVHLVLDAYHQKDDYEGLIRYGKEIMATGRIGDATLRKDVAAIVTATESKVVSSLTIAALDDWEKGKNDLIDYAGKATASGMSEGALRALILSSREKQDLETFFSSGGKLIQQYPRSDQAEETLNLMIGEAVHIAQYRMLVTFLEDFARRFPTHANTPDFLYQAGQIRANLGEYDSSNGNFKKYLISGAPDRERKGEVVLAVVSNAERLNDVQSARSIVETYRKGLTSTDRIHADAQIADLLLKNGDHKQAASFQKMAEGAYRPSMAETDPELRDHMAAMAYHSLQGLHTQFMQLQLRGTLDNKVVKAKSQLLERIEKGYQAVMQYKSPEWALSACYNAHEINLEFARFLKNAPIPQLSPAEEKQYRTLVNTQARQYTDKADQYLASYRRLGEKWEICSTILAGLPKTGAGTDRSRVDGAAFTGQTSSLAIDASCLKDENLKALHLKLYNTPEDTETLQRLTEAYLSKGDFRQTILMANKAAETADADRKSAFHNILGVCYLYAGEDRLAQVAFQRSLELNADNMDAAVNLAALLDYYGHSNGALRLYRKLPTSTQLKDGKDRIHPRAREFYNAYYHTITNNG